MDTGHYTLHRIPIPIFCDNLYQAELYVTWVVLRAPACARWYTRYERWSLTDSNSYITALGSRNDSTSPLVTSLLAACRALVRHTASPRHLYSHLTGTFLDRLMDAVDCLAREEGLSQIPRYRWIPDFQQLPVLFTHSNRQVQDLQALLVKKIPACLLSTLNVPNYSPSTNLLLYERVVRSGSVKWDIHLRAIAIRQGLYTPPPRIYHLLHVCSHNHPTTLYSRVLTFGLPPDCYTYSTRFGHFRLCATLVC